MARTKRTPFRSYPGTGNPISTTSSQKKSAQAPLARSDSVKFNREGKPVVPAKYDDPLSKSIYYKGKAYSTTPARATDQEIEDDLAQMRMTWDGKPYVKPAVPEEVLPEFDNYGYRGRKVLKPNSRMESNVRNDPPTGEELVFDYSNKARDERIWRSSETSNMRDEPLVVKEVTQASQLKDKEAESSIETPDASNGSLNRDEGEDIAAMADILIKAFLEADNFGPTQASELEDKSSSTSTNSDMERETLMENVVQDSQFEDKEAEVLPETHNMHCEDLVTEEVAPDSQFEDKQAETLPEAHNMPCEDLVMEDVAQDNQSKDKEAETLSEAHNMHCENLVIEEVAQDNQPEDNGAENLPEAHNMHCEDLVMEEVSLDSQFKEKEAEAFPEVHNVHCENLVMEEVAPDNQFKEKEAETLPEAQNMHCEDLVMEEVAQDNQSKDNEAEALPEAHNMHCENLVMEEVALDNQINDKAAETLSEAHNVHCENLVTEEVAQDNQFKDKEVETLPETHNVHCEDLAMEEVAQDSQLKEKEAETLPEAHNMHCENLVIKEVALDNKIDDKAAETLPEAHNMHCENLAMEEVAQDNQIKEKEPETLPEAHNVHCENLVMEEVAQDNQIKDKEVETLPEAHNVHCENLVTEEVAQDNQFKDKEPETLPETHNVHGENLVMEEVSLDIQINDAESESSAGPSAPTALAPANCAVYAGAPVNSRKRKMREMSELTDDSLASLLDTQMSLAEVEEGPPRKKLRSPNGAVNLPIPPEKPPTSQKAAPARAKRPAARRDRRAGGGRARRTARASKAASAVGKSTAKGATPDAPSGAETLPANTEKLSNGAVGKGDSSIDTTPEAEGSICEIVTDQGDAAPEGPSKPKTLPTNTEGVAGEPAAMARTVATTGTVSEGAIKKENPPIGTAPEVEGSICEIITIQDNDQKNDESYAPVAPRRRAATRKCNEPAAPRKPASAKDVGTSKEETTVQQEAKPSAAIPELGTGLITDNTKPAAAPRSSGVKGKATELDDKTAVEQEAGFPGPSEVGVPPTTVKPAPRQRERKPRAPRKRVKKAVDVPENGAVVGERAQQSTGSEVEVVLMAEKSAPAPVRKDRRKASAPKEGATGPPTPPEVDTGLATGSDKPAPRQRRRAKKAVNVPGDKAIAGELTQQPADPEIGVVLVAEKSAPAPRPRNRKRKAVDVAEDGAIMGDQAQQPANSETDVSSTAVKSAPRPRKRARKAVDIPKDGAIAGEQAQHPANSEVDAAPAIQKPAPGPAKRPRKRKVAAPEEPIPPAATTSAETGTTQAKESAKPAAGPKRGGRKNSKAPEVEVTGAQGNGPPDTPKMNAVKIEEPSPASSRLHAKRKAAAMEESITLSATSPIEIDITPAPVPRKRGKRIAKDEVTIQGDTGLGLGITKSSVAARNRGVRRKVTEPEGVVANGQEAGPPPAAESSAGKANTIPQDAAIGLLTSINADTAPAQEGTAPATDGREPQKERVDIPEVGATPEAGSATTAEKPALVPAAGSPGSEVALPEERSTNAAVSGTSVAADPAPPPPPPVRRPRYRTPRPGTRKSKRTNPDPEPEPEIPE